MVNLFVMEIMWFNTCSGDTYIRYQNQWVTFGNSLDLAGPRGPEDATTIIGHKEPVLTT